MNRKDPETSEWVKRAQNGDKLFSYTNVNAVHIISFVRDRDLRIQGEVKDEGHACWRIINESTTRKRRMLLRATVRSGKAVWERVCHPLCPMEIEVEVELSRCSGQDYSEKFIAKGEGEEAIITRCQKYPETLASGFIIKPATHPAPPASTQSRSSTIRVFVSYSHKDKKYLEGEGSLLEFLSGLKREGFEFWYDNGNPGIKTGDLWDEKIKEAIGRAHIALVLLSQPFLTSEYCMDVEVERFLIQQKERGLIIFPIILSPCDWKSLKWLSTRQCEPREGRSILRHYKDKGRRAELYLRLLERLRELGEEIRKEPGNE